jgi:hypothetical protein
VVPRRDPTGAHGDAFAHDLLAALDPCALAARAGFPALDPWQQDVLRSPAPRLLLDCCRQSGKSTVTALLAAHEALYHPGSLALLLSPSERQSQELFRKVVAAYHALGRPMPPESETTLWIELESGARVVALPGSTERTVRGFSGVTLLVVDEAARVPDALYFAVRPMLAVSGGRLVLLSTPFGKRGAFYQAWAEGGGVWERYEVPAGQCPRISPAFLEDERRGLPPLVYQSEYECRFVDTTDQVFATADIEAARRNDIAPLFAPPPPPQEAARGLVLA